MDNINNRQGPQNPLTTWDNSAIYKFAQKEYSIMEELWNNAYNKEGDIKKKNSMVSDKEFGKMIHEHVLELLKVFQEQNNSQEIAGFIIAEFKRLANLKPITPLSGNDSEWKDVFTKENGEIIQQNQRCFSIFRTKGDNSTAENNDGIAFSDNGGQTWYTNKHSVIPIKFPYIVPDDLQRKVLSKEEKEKMDAEDKAEWDKFITEHPDYMQKIQEQMSANIRRPTGEINGQH